MLKVRENVRRDELEIIAAFDKDLGWIFLLMVKLRRGNLAEELGRLSACMLKSKRKHGRVRLTIV